MSLKKRLADLHLQYNPFEPAASGAPIDLSAPEIPPRWQEPLESFLDTMQHTRGPKAYAILGEYGSGKTYLLQWLQREAFPVRRIQPFYFQNPGVQFYDLANSLLRQIGRVEFGKLMWEILYPKIDIGLVQGSLFSSGFDAWLESIRKSKQRDTYTRAFQDAIKREDITKDDEIAYSLARLIIETADRPYFEYKDFVAGRTGALVAEHEEAPYFAAIIRALRLTSGATSIAFLLDEFEEVSNIKRLGRRGAYDYLATLRRLINVASRENFWLIVAMTQQAEEITNGLEPALWERFISKGHHRFQIPPLNDEEATALVTHRLRDARVAPPDEETIFPFPDNLASILRQDVKSSPRKLVKVCSLAIAQAVAQAGQILLPFSEDYVERTQNTLYPLSDSGEERTA